MAENTIPHQKHIGWTQILYTVGILGIVVAGLFVYYVIRDTDDLTHDPLPDSIPQLSPEQVQERLQQTNQVILLDVRSSYEWETTPHIEGAVSMPLMDVYGNALTELDPDTEIIVMCYSGNTRSMKAAAWLQENGFENISNLDGGLRAWQQAQLPIEAANRNGDTQSDSDDDTPADNAESSHNYPSAGDQAASQNYSLP